MRTSKRFLGITVMSPYMQSEGVGAVLANVVDHARATAVACNTSVTAPCAEGDGSFQPPDDAGASVHVFDRPLWGQNALWLRSGPGHRADLRLFEASPYKPRTPNDLTDSEEPVIRRFVHDAKEAGLKVYLQTGATDPPGLHDDDRPRLPDGSLPVGRMANTGSLASVDIRRYIRAWTQDIFAAYPDIDGIRPDWPEYPCYTLGEAFQDFGEHVAAWANTNGFDFPLIRSQALEFWSYLHGGLTNRDLAEFAEPDRGRYAILRLYNRFPGVAEWFRLKAALSSDLLREWREAIESAAGPTKELAANAFMTPFSYVTGMDFTSVCAHCHSVAPKLYTMHWSLMVRFWGDELLAYNPGLDENLLTRALVGLFDISDDLRQDVILGLDQYGYPAPDQPHPIPDAPQQRKIQQVVSAVGGRAHVYALVHGYGPLPDFRRRLQLVADSPVDGVWINRYGYLSDDKLDAIGEIWM